MVFKPLGNVARWKLAFEVLFNTRPGDQVTFEQVGHALELDPRKDRHTIQMAVRDAAKVLEEEHYRAIRSIRNVGWRICEPQEHLELARKHQTRASRSLVRGQSKVINVDLTGVEPPVRHAIEVMARAFSMQMDFNKRFEVKQERLEQSINAIEETSNRSEKEIDELKQRLARLEDRT